CNDGVPPFRTLPEAVRACADSVASGEDVPPVNSRHWFSAKTPEPVTVISTNDPPGANGPAAAAVTTLPRAAAACSPVLIATRKLSPTTTNWPALVCAVLCVAAPATAIEGPI